MTFDRPPAADDPAWPRASDWLAGERADTAGTADPGARARAITVVGVPCSVGSISPSRADLTPPAVREALARLSPWDVATGTDLAATPVRDVGDWPVAALDLEPAMAEIERRARELTDDGVVVALGGDNAITRPLVRGLLADVGLDRVGLVTLDAHHDVRSLDGGPRNGTPVRGLVEDGLDARHVVQIGIGRFANSAPYAAWAADRGITVVDAPSVHAHGVDAAVEHALATLDGVDVIAVDLDVDVLDVAYAPACPGARPGGLTPDQLLRAATRLGRDPRVRVVDLVEVDCSRDHGGRTVLVTAMALLAVAAGVAGRPPRPDATG